MTVYNPISEEPERTVVACYEIPDKEESAYESESALEDKFIKQLQRLGYEYISIADEKALIDNLRKQIERLNNTTFTDTEWNNFFKNNIAKDNETIQDKTKRIQEENNQDFITEEGEYKNIILIDKNNIHNNFLQVINQYTEEGGKYKSRYDVTILVNGLPLVHIELKRRGVVLKEAFNQIKRYQREAFWAGNRLFEYIQIFVISNGTHTKYYSNTTREAVERENNNETSKHKTSNSYEFTSFWSDERNHRITDLMDFTKTFFSYSTILNILTKYCVFTYDRRLLVMRPYQIVATEKILHQIRKSTNNNEIGTIKAGGYIWHTTGSGKTLTSFKTAILASSLRDFNIDKVLFVVDRKDLDYQTQQEYNKFKKGSTNSCDSSWKLKTLLEDNTKDTKIIVTTIQKLDTYIKKNDKKNDPHNVCKKHIVIIFDECHRSQFGLMHKRIVKYFDNYHMFGFTGTPIFPENISSNAKLQGKTTEALFGEQLHCYTIVNAINDNNVLPFHIDYVTSVKINENTQDKKVVDIDTESILSDPKRLKSVVSYILEHFDQKTKRNIYDAQRNTRGFNSLFAVSSIGDAIQYYRAFKETGTDLKIALIYSYGANDESNDNNYIAGSIDDENNENVDKLDKTSRDALEEAISDYNKLFNTNFNTSGDGFNKYYNNVAKNMKDKKIDILIVVNMFLTGFDAPTLNTLWLDKNLKYHGLLQAFSRTNRILNSVKNCGNIVCFRNLEQATDDAISLFGNEKAGGIIKLRTFKEYLEGYTDDNGKYHKGYKELIEELFTKYPLGADIIGEEKKNQFIHLWGAVLKLMNILSSFDEFDEIKNDILSERNIQDYTSIYNDFYEEHQRRIEKENVNNDIVFELALVKHAEITVDYILQLVEKFRQNNNTILEINEEVNRCINSSPTLRSKKELILAFIEKINATPDNSLNLNISESFYNECRNRCLEDLQAIIKEEDLKEKETMRYFNNCLKDNEVNTSGNRISKLMNKKFSLFSSREKTLQNIEAKARVIFKFQTLFSKYQKLNINLIDDNE